jgi:2-keto-3-deoxy-L-rhamnonate aldolase RhmA
MAPSFKEMLRSKQPLIGTLVTLPNPLVSELLSLVGFDWLWIDMEHAPLSLEQVQTLLQAKKNECLGLVRIPENAEVWIKRVLDLGADGIIVPQVKSSEEARKAVMASKYPPAGTRSAGIARAQGWGINLAEYIETSNSSISVLLQIEHLEGVKNLDAILTVEGVDGIIVGPYDLSGSFGKLGQVQDREVAEAIEKIQKTCQKVGMPCGIFALTSQAAQSYLQSGFRFVAVGIDSHYMLQSAQASLNSLKGSV